jgi:RNA polymerase sigma-70 factor (ECF subfamily)
MDPADYDFLQRLKQRDTAALRQWIDDSYDDVFRFMHHLTRQRESAEDLAQQTFVKAFEGLKSFEGRASMRTWLHKIAFREYVRWRRFHRLTLPLELLGGSRDRNVERVDQNQALLTALHEQAPALREAFLLYEVQGLTIEEIVLVTGSPTGTVKSRLHHARQGLQKSLKSTFKEVVYEC